MKKKLICDNNFWYRVSKKGLADINFLIKNYELHITHLSIVELISSNNIESNFDIVKDVFIAISKYAKIISQNDAQQLLIAQGIDFTESNILQQQVNIKKIVDLFVSATSTSDLGFNYRKMIDLRKEETGKWAENVNSMVQSNRDKNISDDDLKKFSMQILEYHLYTYIQKNDVKLTSKNFDFSIFELFNESFTLYFKDLLIKKDKKAKPNDYVDFMNLVYCTDNYKYLTLEKLKGNRIAKMIVKSSVGYKYLIPEQENIKEILNQ